ncbi:MAG: hypothetical protein J0M12_05560 [Deltaproteobacteria bacterium]|nr:hypothetical protein [Deltaproteobacteria bacterium]
MGALSNGSYAAFTGTFDGCYHTISNAKATFLTSSTTVDSGRAGFFWEVGSSGRVENLALLNTQFSFRQGPSGLEPRFGGMVAAILYGTVSNVQVNGGQLDCVLRNAQGVVVKAGSWCGGIAGKVGSLSPVVQGGVLVSLKQGVISSSSSSAEVVGGSTLGGLVGVFYGRIENSEASGAVRGGSELGGLVGSLRITFSVSNGTQIPRDFWPSIYRSKSHSSINVQVDLIESILNSYGGLVGNASINEGLNIDESYADGAINIPSSWATTLLPRSSAPIANWGYLGGLVGSANNIHVKDSYSRSNISAVGTPKVGGLVGLLSGEVVEIKSSYYSATATAVSPRGIVGNNNAPYTCGVAPFNSFWNSSLLSGGSYCGSALTAAQMASASAFTSAGWLPTIWNFSGPTPRLINTP